MPKVFADLLRKSALQGRRQELPQDAKKTGLGREHKAVDSVSRKVVFQSVHDLAVKVLEESITSLLLG
jgi:hypothetical protein